MKKEIREQLNRDFGGSWSKLYGALLYIHERIDNLQDHEDRLVKLEKGQVIDMLNRLAPEHLHPDYKKQFAQADLDAAVAKARVKEMDSSAAWVACTGKVPAVSVKEIRDLIDAAVKAEKDRIWGGVVKDRHYDSSVVQLSIPELHKIINNEAEKS